MGRKKVTLNNNPLEAQTIGKIKKHSFGFFAVIIVMVIFGVVIFFLPTLNTIYENYERTGVLSFHVNDNVIITNTNKNTVVNNTVEPDNNTVKEITYLTLNTDDTVSFSNVEFNGITYDEKQVKVTINSNTSSTLVLSRYSYFMRLYNKDKELVKTYYFSNNVNGQSTISVNVSKAVYFNIVSYEDSDYPYLLLDVDELNQSYLHCSRNNTEITYTFKDEKLNLIEDVVTLTNPSETTKSQYATLENDYEMINGVDVTIDDTNPYRFIMKIDMQKYTGSLKSYYFTKDAYPREVKYKLEAMDFTCR